MDGYSCTSTTTDGAKPRRVVLGLEFGVKTLPVVVFLVAATVRFLQIRHIARGKVLYSNILKAKVVLSFLMGLLVFINLPANYIQNPDNGNSTWVSQCGLDGWSWFYALDAVGWFVCCYLLVFEYQRLMTEAWYSTKLFWVLNILCAVVTIMVLNTIYFNDTFMLLQGIIGLIFNTALIVLSFVNDRQNKHEKLDETLIYNANDEENQKFQSQLLDASMQSFSAKKCQIQVKFQEKAVRMQRINFFVYRVQLSIPGIRQLPQSKLQKSYEEF